MAEWISWRLVVLEVVGSNPAGGKQCVSMFVRIVVSVYEWRFQGENGGTRPVPECLCMNGGSRVRMVVPGRCQNVCV